MCAEQSQPTVGAAVIQSIDNGVPNDRSTSLGRYPEGARIAKGSLSSAPGTPVASGTNPVCPVANGASFTLATRWLVDQGGEQVTEFAESGTKEIPQRCNAVGRVSTPRQRSMHARLLCRVLWRAGKREHFPAPHPPTTMDRSSIQLIPNL